MITLIAQIIGTLSSGLPAVLKYFQDRQDKKHELDLMDKQIQMAQMNIQKELDAITINAESAERIAESNEQIALHKSNRPTGIKWVDAYNASVRPTLAYCFFLLAGYMSYKSIDQAAVYAVAIEFVLTTCSYIIGFYFGNRSFYKAGK